MPLPTGLRALANRNFRVYYAGNLVAQVGSWMQTVSQSWLVLQLTDSPFLLGLIATLQSGPILLLAVFTGVLADRLTRRNILLVTHGVQGALALVLGLLVWSGHVRYGHVALMAVICRYPLLPPLATERLTPSSGGQLLYELPHPRSGGP